jgi:hypothetical protein
MKLFDTTQVNDPAIGRAATHFLTSFAGDEIQKDLILAAELAGLQLLRQCKVRLDHLRPGAPVFDPGPNAGLAELQRFVSRLAKLNGLDPNESDFAGLTPEAMRYRSHLVQFEPPLRASCRLFAVPAEQRPYVAATAAIKLVVAGQRLNRFTSPQGIVLVIHHVLAGAKTVPYQEESLAT